MAVNPNIALSVRGLELPDPLAQYGKVQAIQAAQQQNALAQMQMQQAQREVAQRNALNRAYAQAYSPEGQFDINRLRTSLATGGFGSQIPAAEEQYFKTQQARTKQLDAETELALKKMSLGRETLGVLNPQDLQGYQGWLRSQFSDPQMKEIYDSAGVTLDQALARAGQAAQEGKLGDLIQASAMTYQQLQDQIKPVQIDRNGAIDFVEPRTNRVVSTFEKTPLPEDVAAQKIAQARAGVATPQSTYELAVGKNAAERDTQLVDQAQSAPAAIQKIDETLRLLESGQAITGLASELETLIASAQAKFLRDEQAGVKVRDSQYLDALLGSDVFPQMSVLGVGARGLDTPAERKFLQDVITGQRQLSRDALIKITENRRRAFENQVKKYNERVEAGELDRYFDASGLRKQTIDIPNRSATGGAAPSGIPQAAIDALLKGEGTDEQFDQYFGTGSAARVRGGR